MIQVILKDGTAMRFTDEIIGVNEYDIAYQKVLTVEEELLRPININGQIAYIDNKNLFLQSWTMTDPSSGI